MEAGLLEPTKKCPNGGTFGRCAANITQAQKYEEQAETPTG